MNKKIFLGMSLLLISLIALSGCIVVADDVTVTVRDYGLNVILDDERGGASEDRLTIYNEMSFKSIDSVKTVVVTSASDYTEPSFTGATERLSSDINAGGNDFWDIVSTLGASSNNYVWVRITSGSDYAVIGFLYEEVSTVGDMWNIFVSED